MRVISVKLAAVRHWGSWCFSPEGKSIQVRMKVNKHVKSLSRSKACNPSETTLEVWAGWSNNCTEASVRAQHKY